MKRWPQLGDAHADGSRFVGRDLGPVQKYWDAGTPVVNKLVQASVDLDAVRRLSVGDSVDVRFDGVKQWHAYVGPVRLGRLPWSPGVFEPQPWQDQSAARVDDGVMEVTRLLLLSRRVINVGGIVRPR